MNDDQKISVQIPSEVMNEISKPAEQANRTAQSSVTLQFTQESVRKLEILWKDMAELEESRVANSHTGLDRFIKTTEVRTSFYEKLILLAGGSFALSLTFLGSLRGHALQASPLLAMGRFKIAWVLLLGCIIFSWLHNLYWSATVDHATIAHATYLTSVQNNRQSFLFTRAAALFKAAESPEVGLGEAVKIAAEGLALQSQQSLKDRPKLIANFKRSFFIASILGFVATASIIVAFVFMIVFAIKNAALL